MSAIVAFTDRFKGQFQGGLNVIRTRLLGANNEKLDFVMDSFNKLAPQQRTYVLAGIVAGIAAFVLLAIVLYFTQVNALRNDLSSSFAALHELQGLRSAYETENRNFEKLVDTVGKKTRQSQLKPYFEKTGQDLGMTIEGLQESRSPLSADNPLQEKMEETRIEMRLPNTSIPRLMNFLVEVEKSGKYLRVQDLTIRGRYGTKLFFDSQAKIRGYAVK